MRTKHYIMAALASVAAFANVALAGDPTGLAGNAGNVNGIDNTQSMLSYNHGGGSGDGAFSGNVIHIGVGFVSGEGNLYTGSGYTSSVSPAFELCYERALSSRFGIGLNISYQPAKETYTYQGINPTTFQPETYTDTYKLSLLQFCARGAYHFSAGDKFDPYVGVMLGYCTISDSYSSTDPGNSSSSSSLTGVEFGGFGGARYFFSDHVGAWVELQYAVASFKVGSAASGYSASVSINPCTVINAGLAFKF